MSARRKFVSALIASLLAGLVALQAPSVSPVSAVNGATPGWKAVGGGLQGTGWNPRVMQLIRASDGTLFAGGTFTGAVATLSATDGSSWQTVTGVANGPTSAVYAIGLDEAANPPRLYAGGDFSNALQWMNVSTGAWTDVGNSTLNVEDGVEKLAVKSATEVYLGGSFNGGPSGVDWGLSLRTGAGFSAVGGGVSVSGQVNALSLAGDSLYVGGRFAFVSASASPIAVRNVAVYSTTNSAWTTFGASDFGPTNWNESVIAAIAVQNASSVFVGGTFASMQNGTGQTVANTKGIAKWNGSAWVSIGQITGTVVEELRIIGGYLYAGGEFTAIGGVTANNIARMELSSGTWEPLVQACFNGVNGVVRSIIDANDGNDSVYVAGGFTDAGGISAADRVAKYTPGASTFCPNAETAPVLAFDAPPNFRAMYYGQYGRLPNYNNGQQGLLIDHEWDAPVGVNYYIYKVSAERITKRTRVGNKMEFETVPLDSSYDCWSVGLTCTIIVSKDDPYFAKDELLFRLRGFTFEGVGKSVTAKLPGPYDPVFPPGIPTDVVATPGWGTVTVTYKAPAYTGSYPITNYLVQASPGGSVCITRKTDPSLLSCPYTNLTPGINYKFTVQALNGAGWGVKSVPMATGVSPQSIQITKNSRTKATFLFINRGSDVVAEGIAPGYPAGSAVTAWVMFNNDGKWIPQGDVKISAFGTFSWKKRFDRNRNNGAISVTFTLGSNQGNVVSMGPVR